MDQVRNPYNPGAGARPYELAGRAAEVQELDVALQRLLIGRSGKSQLITGLHGVGKTVLLYEFSRTAARRGFIHEHIEVGDDGRLPQRLAVALRKALLKLGGKKKVKGVNRRALGVLKAFTLTLPEGGSLLTDVDVVPGACRLGRPGQRPGRPARGGGPGGPGPRRRGVPDHRRDAPSAGGQSRSPHRRPVPGPSAGPSCRDRRSRPAHHGGLSGEARSYLERMFRFRPLGPLAPDEGADALVEPAAAEGVSWKAGALTRVYEVTMGYPYFIQEFAHQAWDLAEEGSKVIRVSDVERSLPLATAELDEGFLSSGREDHRAGAGLPAGHGRTGPRRRQLGRGGGAPREEDHPGRPGAGHPDEEGHVLLAPLQRAGLHRSRCSTSS